MSKRAFRKITTYVLLFAGLFSLLLIGVQRFLSPPWNSIGSLVLVIGALATAAYLLDMMVPGVNIFSYAPHRLPQSGNRVVLTFDDGPVEPFTRQILDILERYGVPAVFFCIGENVERFPQVAKEIVMRGHELANHTQSHRVLPFLPAEKVEREIRGGANACKKASGVRPVFFRCPKGYKTRRVLKLAKKLGQQAIGFSYPIFDVENPLPETLIHNVLHRVKGGDILLMHDGFRKEKPASRDSLVAALPKIIEGVRGRGLEFVRLSDALAETLAEENRRH